MAQWRADGLQTVPVCANPLARQLRNAHGLSELVRQTLQQHQTAGSDLAPEIGV
jgi:hypothetical protein